MPEGHTIHRWARRQRADFAGRAVRCWSPQGRFGDGAALIDGRVLRDVEAFGKHLFYRWDTGLRLHVHLGLIGKFRRFDGDAPPPTDGTRLALAADAVTVYLAGPMACELLDPDACDRIVGALGPDPLRDDADPERAWQGLRRRSVPIGQALLDQRVIAGIGNAFRAEALFVTGIDPGRQAKTITRLEFDRLWQTLSAMLREGLRTGQIVTVEGAGPDAPLEDLRFVYRREGLPCHRCGTRIRGWRLGGRLIRACPTCQSLPVRAPARQATPTRSAG